MDKISQENTDLKMKLIEDFSNLEASLNGQSNEMIHNVRRDAIAYINENGFPTKKFEEWKYTNPANILKNDYVQAFTQPGGDLSGIDVSEVLAESNANVLVYVNGRYESSLSRIVSKGVGIFVGNFSEAYISHKELINSHFSKLAKNEKGAFTAMNTAFATDGAVVYAADNVQIPEIIRIINIADARTGTFLSQPRNIFIVGVNAKAMISEEFFTIGENPSLTNMVTEVFCGRGSMLEHYKIQNDGANALHVGSTQIRQDADSHYSNTTISWGGKIIRNNLQAEFAGNNTECHFFGLYLLSGRQHVDNHTLADHAMPNCYSNELYKGIIADRATGVFNGRIMVREDAQKTNAYQSNNCILLSDDAMNYSKPQLEIFADDVKCSHGATTGQLSDQEMFYLRSRGIPHDEARAMLLQAFAEDVIDTVKDEYLRDKLNKKLTEILMSTC
jgi:Fe-S cluster assembly protein SufD